MTHKDVGRLFSRILQERMQLKRDLGEFSRHRSRIAPTISGSVIGANTREARYPWLYKMPSLRGHFESRLKDNSWASFASAIDIELVTANVNHLSLLVESARIFPGLNSLIKNPGHGEEHSDC